MPHHERPRYPRELPPGFGEIWEALDDADRRATSRGELARELRVSTQTIQRILVAGDVPSFPHVSNNRVIQAWARVITRLAYHFGKDPREWIEMVGITWDKQVQESSDRTLRVIGPRRPAKTAWPGPSGKPVPGRIQIGRKDGRIHIAIAECGPFSQPLGATRESFLATFAQRLVGAIEPAMTVDTVSLSEEGAVKELVSPDCRIDLGIGIRDTVSRRRLGLDFVAIPGWQVNLAAITIRRSGRMGHPPSWSAAIVPFTSDTHQFMVREGGVAHHYLVGQCGWSAKSLLLRPMEDVGQLAEAFHREAEKETERWIVLLADEHICRRVALTLREREEFGRGFSVAELATPHEEYPGHRLAVALPPGSGPLRDLIVAALEGELFGSSYGRTASLYAELVSEWSLRRLRPFPQASPEFQENFCRSLVNVLEHHHASRLAATSETETASKRRIKAWELAVSTAENLIPSDWLPRLHPFKKGVAPEPPDSAAGPAPQMPTNRLAHCLSCSASLHEEHNQGVSDRFCRYCADEEGNLKPREEVERLIAEWLNMWQGGLPPEKALRRARIFMQAMPAWSDN